MWRCLSVENLQSFDGFCFCFLQTVFSYNTGSQQTCAHNRHQCSVHAECRDYATGFCCRCVANYTGNGRQCVAEGNVLFMCIFSFTDKDKRGFGSWSLFIDVSFALVSGICSFLMTSSLLHSLWAFLPGYPLFFFPSLILLHS